MSDKKKARGLLSPQVKADIESIYGKGSADFKVEVDPSLAGRGKGGLVDPKSPGVVKVADSPDFDENPRLRDIVLAHEAGHLKEGDKLHGKTSNIGRVAHKTILGANPKEMKSNLEALRGNPDEQDRVYNSLIKEAQEKSTEASGPLGAIKQGLRYITGSGRYEDETLSDFLVRRTGKPLDSDRSPGG